MGRSQATQSVLQQLDQARFEKLCESASSLLNKPVQLPANPSRALLMKILKAVAAEQFKSKYSYDFQRDDPKPSNVADDATLNIGSVENICCIRDVNEISSFVNSILLNSVEPAWARKSASADVVNQGNAIFKATPEDSWRSAFIDKLYGSAEPEDNSFKIDAVLVHCTILIDEKTYAFIYYAGVYYQVLSPKRVAENKLLANLISLANDLLGQTPIPVTSPSRSIQLLKAILRTYGKRIFEEQFGFPYNEDKTSPNDKPPGARLHATDAICFIKNEDSNVVDSFIKNVVNVIYLPHWTKDDGSKALLTEAKGLLHINTNNGWNHAFFVSSYDNPIPGNNSYKTTAVFVYANASTSGGNVTAKISFIYYLGVYYGSFGPLAIARNAHLTRVCKTAADLVPEHIPIQSPPTIQDLDNILKAHGVLQFQKDFNFPYNGDQTVPNDIARGTQAQGISVLLRVESKDADALREAVQFDILQNIAFPNWAQDHSSQRLQTYMAYFLKGPTGFDWKFFKLIYPVVGKDNSFKTIASLTYSNATVKEGAIELTVTFIYFVGVFYFTPSVRIGNEPSHGAVVS